MTAPMMNFDNQRFMDKLRKMDPETLGAFDAMLNSEGDYAIKRYIQDMRMGAAKESGAARLGLSREGMEQQDVMRNKSIDTRSDIARQGQEQRYGLGMARLNQGADIARANLASNVAIKNAATDFTKDQQRIALPLGIANVGLSGYLGYRKEQKDEETAKKYLDLAGKLYGRT